MMHLYASMFAKHQLNVAQLLLTHSDLDSRTRHQNAKNTLRRLLECKNVVPIINENDSVAVEELRFGDNDRLSAEVAVLAEAELLILLTSVNGLMDHEAPREMGRHSGKAGQALCDRRTSNRQIFAAAIDSRYSKNQCNPNSLLMPLSHPIRCENRAPAVSLAG